MLIFGHSGLASRNGIRPANGVGVIDADYRGPLKVRQIVSDAGPAANELLPTDRLWTSDDCAPCFRISRWTFVTRLSKKPGFPKPHIETSRRMRRWLPEDIKDYRTTKRGR
jgi:hypothetical protein